MGRLNDLLEQLPQKHRRCVEAERLIETAFAAGALEDSHIDRLEQDMNEYEALIEQAQRELEALDETLRNWK